LGYKLPKTLRSSFRKPIGKLFSGEPLVAAKKAVTYIKSLKSVISVSIGDYCTKTLFEVNYFPDIVIYDEKTRRKNSIVLNLKLYERVTTINPQEWILKDAWNVIENTISFCTSNNCRVAISIDGEEDLLVIPTIISLPLQGIIIYGQPPINTDEGIVVVLVSSDIKSLAYELLERFEFHEEFTNGNNYH
jgi:uncharacterized protein (UPF0218 family)